MSRLETLEKYYHIDRYEGEVLIPYFRDRIESYLEESGDFIVDLAKKAGIKPEILHDILSRPRGYRRWMTPERASLLVRHLSPLGVQVSAEDCAAIYSHFIRAELGLIQPPRSVA